MTTALLSAPPEPLPNGVVIPGSEFISVEEVADLFRVSRSTVTFWARTGTLPGAVRVGKFIRWPRSAIAKALGGD